MFILFVSIFSAALINKPNQGDAHRLYTKDGNEGLKIKPTQTCLEPVFFFFFAWAAGGDSSDSKNNYNSIELKYKL